MVRVSSTIFPSCVSFEFKIFLCRGSQTLLLLACRCNFLSGDYLRVQIYELIQECIRGHRVVGCIACVCLVCAVTPLHLHRYSDCAKRRMGVGGFWWLSNFRNLFVVVLYSMLKENIFFCLSCFFHVGVTEMCRIQALVCSCSWFDCNCRCVVVELGETYSGRIKNWRFSNKSKDAQQFHLKGFTLINMFLRWCV